MTPEVVKFERCSNCGAERPYVAHHSVAARCGKHPHYAAFPGDCDACRNSAGLPTQVEEEAIKLRAHAARCETEAARLEALAARYPGIRKHVGRWNKVVYCTASVNARVDRFDMRHNCGCCSDSPLEIFPYVEADKVYSDPPCFRVGYKDKYGDIPAEGWAAEMRAAQIPEVIVGAVATHFDRRRRAMLDEAEDLRARAEGGGVK